MRSIATQSALGGVVALMAGGVGGSGGTKEDTLSLRLAGGADAASSARQALSALRGDLDPAMMETMRLLVTELVSNSVRHAGADNVDLKVVVGRRAVRTEVANEGSGFEPEGRAGRGDGDGGWGLFLVERLASKWGVLKEDARTRVWFELPRA